MACSGGILYISQTDASTREASQKVLSHHDNLPSYNNRGLPDDTTSIGYCPAWVVFVTDHQLYEETHLLPSIKKSMTERSQGF